MKIYVFCEWSEKNSWKIISITVSVEIIFVIGWMNSKEDIANLHIFSTDVDGYSLIVDLMIACCDPHNIATPFNSKNPLTTLAWRPSGRHDCKGRESIIRAEEFYGKPRMIGEDMQPSFTFWESFIEFNLNPPVERSKGDFRHKILGMRRTEKLYT